jgi:hypothetical protein
LPGQPAGELADGCSVPGSHRIKNGALIRSPPSIVNIVHRMVSSSSVSLEPGAGLLAARPVEVAVP